MLKQPLPTKTEQGFFPGKQQVRARVGTTTRRVETGKKWPGGVFEAYGVYGLLVNHGLDGDAARG